MSWPASSTGRASPSPSAASPPRRPWGRACWWERAPATTAASPAARSCAPPRAFQTIPPFVFVIVVVVIARPSIRSIVLAIALVSWPAVARLVRAEFLALRHREFVQGCRAVGMGDLRIIFRQILPNALAPIIVTASIMVATAILTESALAFLGLGDANVMSWGSMIGAGREMLRTEWYLTAIPGLAILMTVLALNLIGEGLNDALNPRLRDQ